jgi:hypothetical protein
VVAAKFRVLGTFLPLASFFHQGEVVSTSLARGFHQLTALRAVCQADDLEVPPA